MATICDETVAAAKGLVARQVEAGKPFFSRWNGTRMHLRTHVRKNHRHPGNDEYTVVKCPTDNGPHCNTWPDAPAAPFRGEKNSNWEGACRVPTFLRWPGHFAASVTLNGTVSHEDWLPTFATIAGAPHIKDRLSAGVEQNGTQVPPPHRRQDGCHAPRRVQGAVPGEPRARLRGLARAVQ
ncbi:MAG: sulfatase-like hydrolase/transferase [Rubrivivax sp.]|nr:sulfatase-like hydrolase/transferase [Rubrivivax sp.]MDH5340303.1 sulfatase-like hydrolase/transferase [Rubrivivax sp.]